MVGDSEFEESAALVLAAEDCPSESFLTLHKFSQHDERTIASLMAHGPVLLRGSRGSGKSALMIEAARRLKEPPQSASALGVYISLRHFKLLRSAGEQYEHLLCSLVVNELRSALGLQVEGLGILSEAMKLQIALTELTSRIGRRIILLFDDAAHLGREASLADFFDVFRTLSSRTVSCKAAIYPGVTRFGNRFDVLNDATVLEVARSEDLPGFANFFRDVMEARYPDGFSDAVFSRRLTKEGVAEFLGRAVLGNMRAFVFACNELKERCGGGTVGLPELGTSAIELAQNYYWPLLDEIRPKLGAYEPMIESAQELGSALFKACGERENSPHAILIHRDLSERLSKPLEILEYAGFIAKREASRAMKSGGRGSRFAMNLCNLLEHKSGSRLTDKLMAEWKGRSEPVEFNRASPLATFELPAVDADRELAILAEPISSLRRSNAYPYGLTENKLELLQAAGFETIADLADADDETILAVPTIGRVHLQRVRNVVGQAIWM